MSFFDALGGSNAADTIADVIGRPSAGNRTTFAQTMKEGDFDHFGNDFSPDEWSRLATFTVPAQESYRWGVGTSAKPDNQGHIFADLRNAAGEELDGKLRLAQTDAQERRHLVVIEEDADALRGSKFDKSMQLALPEQVDKPRVGRDSKLVLEFRPSTKEGEATVDEDESQVSLPVTNYEDSR